MPQVGERWRFRDGGGSAVVVHEVTDRTVRYMHDGYHRPVFGNPVSTWLEYFEPCPSSIEAD